MTVTKTLMIAPGICMLGLVANFFLHAGAVAQEVQPWRDASIPAGIEVVRNVTFAETPQQSLELDLYLPRVQPDEALPLIVWIHGGAWLAGNRHRNPAAGFAKHGYVSASISYRLSDKAIFPAQIHDCKAAIRWLRANAEKYHIDPTRIGVWGASAGGHLAATLGSSGEVKSMEGTIGVTGPSSRVQAVVDFFGPTDFVQMDAAGSTIVHDAPESPESRLVGGPIQKHPQRVAAANPIAYVTADDPPFLIVHGNHDPLVPHHQSVLLEAALKQAGVNVVFHTIEDGGHGDGSGFAAPALREKVLAFFGTHLKSSNE